MSQAAVSQCHINTTNKVGQWDGLRLRNGAVAGGGNALQGDKLLSKPAGTPNVETDGRDKLPVPGIPDSIAKGLSSSDASERLLALAHWAAQGTKAPLKPMFVAMEDDDEVVRSKGIEIIRRYWAAEQVRKRK